MTTDKGYIISPHLLRAIERTGYTCLSRSYPATSAPSLLPIAFAPSLGQFANRSRELYSVRAKYTSKERLVFRFKAILFRINLVKRKFALVQTRKAQQEMSVNHASSSTSTGHAVGATSGVISTSTAASSSKIDFGTFLPVVTEALERLTASASVLPSGSDLSFHRTMNRALAKELDSSSRRVLTMTENLLKMVEAGQEEMKGKSGSKGKGKQVERNGVNGIKARRKLEDEEDVVDGYKRGVIGVVDGLLEDAVSSPYHF